MSLTVEQLAFLRTREGETLIAMPLPDEALSALTILRKTCSPEQAAAVMTMRSLRKRARGKFPEQIAGLLLATDKLLQQASSLRLAVYLGRMMTGFFGTRHVVDICCGLGADAIGMALAGHTVEGIDNAPAAVFCARHNARVAAVRDRCTFRQCSAEDLLIPDRAVVHVDPDRRVDGRGAANLLRHRPGKEYLLSLIRNTRAGCMKLSPLLDSRTLDVPVQTRCEYIGEEGRCRQLLVWWPGDELDAVGNCATVVSGEPESPVSETIAAGRSGAAPTGEAGKWLLEPAPPLVAAGAVDDLAARYGLWRLQRAVPWLSGERDVHTSLAGTYRILSRCPGRARSVAQELQQFDAGEIAVKTSGLKLDTDRLQRKLRGNGRRSLVLFWGRFRKRQVVYITERSGMRRPGDGGASGA